MHTIQIYAQVFLFNLYTVTSIDTPKEVIVKTANGYISGLELQDYNNNLYYAFQSVPYAQPPIGDLRFLPPKESLPWVGVKDGTRESPQCVQPAGPTFVGQEDCLYLNVYTNALNNSHLQPVVVYIHPGGFFRSSGIFSNANPKLLITENIVIVTINYRLSAFGFLTLGNSTLITPNNGFRDQVMVLKWIQNNIMQFGGNPYSVTISGVSAGGLSAHYHLYSPLSKGLFHKIISRSNTVLAPLEPLKWNTAIELAEELDINTENFTSMIQELRNISVEDLYKAQERKHWFDFYLDKPMYSGLYIEKPSNWSFISDSLLSATKSGNFNRVPMMLSNTNMEGMVFNSSAIPNLWQMTNISIHVPSLFGVNHSLMVDEVENYYFNNNSFKYPYYEFWGDIWYKHAAYRTLQFASKYQKIYMMNFGLDTNLNVFKLTHSTIANVDGACHTDDDSYIYNKLLSPQIVPNSLEETWMKRMIRLQANFIKYSNPTPFSDNLLMNVKWKPYRKASANVLMLNNTNMWIGKEYNKNFGFWERMYQIYAPGK